MEAGIPKLNGPTMFGRGRKWHWGIEREQIWGQKPRLPVRWRWEDKWWGQIRAESQLSWRGWSAA